MTEDRLVFRRLFVAGVVLALAGPVAAQQSASMPDQDEQKLQVRAFEGVLKTSIENAGARLAKRASQFAPVELAFDASPAVSGVVVPDVGPVFDVQIPLILQTGLALLQRQLEKSKPGQPVAEGPARVASTTVADDVMTKSPVVAAGFDPDREYTAYVREGLLDAILDFPSAFSVKDGEWLTIIAREFDRPGNVIYSTAPRKMILKIRGADLTAFRQGKLTRDEAKQKIVDTRF